MYEDCIFMIWKWKYITSYLSASCAFFTYDPADLLQGRSDARWLKPPAPVSALPALGLIPWWSF